MRQTQLKKFAMNSLSNCQKSYMTMKTLHKKSMDTIALVESVIE